MVAMKDHFFDPASRRLPSVDPDICWVCKRPRALHPPGMPAVCRCVVQHFRIEQPCELLLDLIGEMVTSIEQRAEPEVVNQQLDAVLTHGLDALMLNLREQT